MRVNYSLGAVFISIMMFLLLISLNLAGWISSDYLSDKQYSVVFFAFCVSIIILFFLQKESFTSIGFLFNACLFLFIGGRFLAITLGINETELFALNFMTYYNPSDQEKLEIFTRVVFFQLFFNMGYFFIHPSKQDINKPSPKVPILPILIVVIFLFLWCIYEQLEMLYKALSEGYLSRYGDQADGYDAGLVFKYTLLFVLTGLLFSTRNRGIILLNFIIYMSLATVIILIGARGTFVSTLLMGVWLYGLHKKIGLLRLSLVFGILAATLLIIMNFSARGNYYSTELTQSMLKFLYDQGNTLAVIGYVRTIDSYPVFTYISTFLPGSSFVASLFYGNNNLNSYMLSFPAYANFIANKEMYFSGYGLGWSIISSVEMFSADVLVFFCLISFLIGCILKYANEKAKVNGFWFGAVACLCAKILFVTRADVKTIIPLFIYYIIAYYILTSVVKLYARKP